MFTHPYNAEYALELEAKKRAERIAIAHDACLLHVHSHRMAESSPN
jgi:hypothetical protein